MQQLLHVENTQGARGDERRSPNRRLVRLIHDWARQDAVSCRYAQREMAALLEAGADVGDIFRGLRAALDQLEASRWRPISEAPKDGTHFIVPGGTAYWNAGLQLWISDQANRAIQWDVKVWMPLPSPPATTSEGE